MPKSEAQKETPRPPFGSSNVKGQKKPDTGGSTLFLGGLNTTTTEEMIKVAFSLAGAVESVSSSLSLSSPSFPTLLNSR